MSSITPVTTNSFNAPSSALSQANFKQRKADFQALSTALQNNDLASAQQAFAQLQKDDPKLAQALKNQDSSTGSPLASLAQALQSGNLSGAQQAFASIKSNAASAQGGAVKGHHHHHRGGSQNQDAKSVTGTTSDTSSPGVGGVINAKG